MASTQRDCSLISTRVNVDLSATYVDTIGTDDKVTNVLASILKHDFALSHILRFHSISYSVLPRGFCLPLIRPVRTAVYPPFCRQLPGRQYIVERCASPPGE